MIDAWFSNDISFLNVIYKTSKQKRTESINWFIRNKGKSYKLENDVKSIYYVAWNQSLFKHLFDNFFIMNAFKRPFLMFQPNY